MALWVFRRQRGKVGSMVKVVVLAIGLLVFLVACGGAESAPAAVTGQSSPSQEVTEPAPSSSVAAEPTAESVVAALKAAGLPVGDVKAYTAEDDPNALLGRPGQYIGKAAFHDTRISADVAGAFDVQRGGSVELFASAGDAEQRSEYVAAATQAISPLAEYDYQHGEILLRLSHELTPEQAAEYEAALKAR